MVNPIVALAWATKKRHIAFDGVVLCQPKIKSAGYSVKNGQYNTLALSGVPDYPKTSDDVKYCHGDGVIPFVPLNQQPTVVSERSICKQCLRKFEKALWAKGVTG